MESRELTQVPALHLTRLAAAPSRTVCSSPDKRGGLNGSMQHQLEVYLAEFKGQI